MNVNIYGNFALKKFAHEKARLLKKCTQVYCKNVTNVV